MKQVYIAIFDEYDYEDLGVQIEGVFSTRKKAYNYCYNVLIQSCFEDYCFEEGKKTIEKLKAEFKKSYEEGESTFRCNYRDYSKELRVVPYKIDFRKYKRIMRDKEK